MSLHNHTPEQRAQIKKRRKAPAASLRRAPVKPAARHRSAY